MTMHRVGLAAIATGALLAMGALGEAEACACCSDTGQRYVATADIQDYQQAEVDRMRFGTKAELFLGSADTSDVPDIGIANPDSSYTMATKRDGKTVTFDFTGSAGQRGSLSMVLPVKVSFFEVDTRETPDTGLGPPIYKEWKFTADPKASGDFAGGAGEGQHLTLILQGHGNNCVSAEDFTHWTLVMEGPKANYLLFGELAKPE